jgi:uncharacterized protein (DUF1499 family)
MKFTNNLLQFVDDFEDKIENNSIFNFGAMGD